MKKITINNLRSLTDTESIELAPLTCLVGKNSIGKSTFLRLFPLFKQSIQTNRSEPLLWYSPELVDFGNFKESVNNHDETKSIDFKFEFNITELDLSNMYFFSLFSINIKARRKRTKIRKKEIPNKEIPIRVSFKLKKNTIKFFQIDIFDYNYKISIDSKGQITTIFVNQMEFPLKKLKILNDSFSRNTLLPNIYAPIEVKGEKTRNYHNDAIEAESKKLLINHLNIIRNGRISDDTIQKIVSSLEFTEKTEFNQRLLEEISEYKTIKRIFDKLNDKQQAEFLEQLYLYNGFIYINFVIDSVNSYLSDYFSNTQYIAPLRASAQRYYRRQGLAIDEISSQGENIPMMLANMKESDRLKWNTWTKKHFNVEFKVTDDEANISLKLVKNGEEINLADTGFGYSQLLPILLYSWKVENGKFGVPSFASLNSHTKTLLIEQPELHLHPALQAKLIDVFMDIINHLKNSLNFSIIIETHSETMINQVGYNLAMKNNLNSEDVNIILFEETNNKTAIKQTKYNDEGFLEDWPIDFFSPSLEVESI